MKKILVISICLLLVPRMAMAQDILGIVLILATVPLLNFIFAILYALAIRSGMAFINHTGIVILWLVLFWFFSSYTKSDFLAWSPIFLSIAHSLFLVYGSCRYLFRGKDRDGDFDPGA